MTIGAVNAFLEVQELSGRAIVREDWEPGAGSPFIYRTHAEDPNGIDLYLSTSSAGGGLQMIVAGVVGTMSTASAERAALGAGAIVMDAISIDDGRESYERVKRIRALRPDIILLAGGTEGGTVDHPLELAELVLQADPRPRFGETLRLPVLYAANSAAQNDVEKLLSDRFQFVAVGNIRPTLDTENLGPARDEIHELFLHHVMSHAPGYRDLLGWTPAPVMPTPAAVGDVVLAAAKKWNESILAVDIGGATTDVFSVFSSEMGEPIFNRTVSANLGMSYSVANVLLEAGEENIRRWLPFSSSADEVRDRLRNKMIRPTSIPYLLEDLLLEQAVCREALRLALIHHKRLATGLQGVQRKRTIGDLFKQQREETLVDMMKLDLIIGSGGVLSHAPDRKMAAMMLLDSYEPQGVTRLAVDSIFMMPHLGVLASVNPEAALEIFVRDCLIPLGTAISPVGQSYGDGTEILEVARKGHKVVRLRQGELLVLALASGESEQANLRPLQSSIDIGNGPGREREVLLQGGEVGVILDGRGRPLRAANTPEGVRAWYEAFGLPTGRAQ